MNNNRYLFSFISALVILISCQQEEISQDVAAMQSESGFYGSMESFSQDTRTSVSSGNKIIWNEGYSDTDAGSLTSVSRKRNIGFPTNCFHETHQSIVTAVSWQSYKSFATNLSPVER